MNTSEIRQTFIDFFEKRGHQPVASSPLIPGNDPTLLFTNAGMVQFKETFLGSEQRNYNRAVTSQRCVRAGGKHNDLENVGYTARHHTFFEMLGNFSFGDYFKEEAIAYAWELLTEVYDLPAEKLWVTVYDEDAEAERIWLEDIGVDPDRLSRIGAKDNFWSMGDTGPCGPCTEIFFDHGEGVPGGPPGTPEEDGDRYVEIWNLVFMQYNRDAEGNLNPLPKPSVDTGMGLERIAAVMQGVHSNYEIDLFQKLIADAARALGVEATDENKSLRVIADHIRACSFLIIDGVTPSNEGRGYVLRRIARRAIRHGYQQGMRKPFMHLLVACLATEMGEAYPELKKNQAIIEQILEKENSKFLETLEQGIKILDDEFLRATSDELSGEVVFKLYDTFGFPYDLTEDYAREQGYSLDRVGFDEAMQSQRERARSAQRFTMDTQIQVDVASTEFVGYEYLSAVSSLVAIVNDGVQVDSLQAGEAGMLVLPSTSFYAESGGQVGDLGLVKSGDCVFEVTDTQYLANKVIGHIGSVSVGEFNVGDAVTTEVTESSRRRSAANHSATHILHQALKDVLGEHVQQKGSLVSANRLRFDFSHFEPVTNQQIQEIERISNAQIYANHRVSTSHMDIDAAKEKGAAALFGEKYDQDVRVVQMGEYSLELCGGTHVSRTGDIGLLKLESETGIAAGVRRVEVLTGELALAAMQKQDTQLQQLTLLLKVDSESLGDKITTLLAANKELDKKLKAAQSKLAMSGGGGGAADNMHEINGVKTMVIRQDNVDVKTLRSTVDAARSQVGEGVVVVAGAHEGKVSIMVRVADSLSQQYPAGLLIKPAMALIDGRGGGKPNMAQGGGSNVEQLPAALDAIKKAIETASEAT
ncbi:MAG: alanyl-tRNA synthetase [Saprospiraceae bacterium]|jgi:alanyl-tRNA synthetase